MVAGRQRREYRLTAAGTRALSGKRADWRNFAATISAALETRPWPDPDVIGGYLAELSAQLPAPIVAELADGLDQTHRRYLGPGLSADAAADAAVSEFGEAAGCHRPRSPAPRPCPPRRPQAPGHRPARRPPCWGTALIIDRAWTWPVPVGGLIVLRH